MAELTHNLEQPVGRVYHGMKVGEVNCAGGQLSDQALTPLISRKEFRHFVVVPRPAQVYVLQLDLGEASKRDLGEALKRFQAHETVRQSYNTPKVFQRMFETNYRVIVSSIGEDPSRLAESPRPVRDTPPVEHSKRCASRQETLRSDLERMYVVDGMPRVLEFVATNKLIGLILQARDPLIAAFGETAIKRLSIVEDDEGAESLFCLVGFSGALDEARRALRSFDEQWWLDRCEKAHGKLNFDFDLI